MAHRNIRETLESKVIEVESDFGRADSWQAVTGVTMPPRIRAEIASRIVDIQIQRCDGYPASNGLRYRWREAADTSPRTWLSFAAMIAAGLCVGFAVMLMACCGFAW